MIIPIRSDFFVTSSELLNFKKTKIRAGQCFIPTLTTFSNRESRSSPKMPSEACTTLRVDYVGQVPTNGFIPAGSDILAERCA